MGSLTAPAVANSDLPGLLGLNSLRHNRAILDFATLRLHFVGPAGIEVEKHLPPGSESFQTELAPSGHMVLPCCEYQRGSIDKDHTLTLIAQKASTTGSGSQRTEAAMEKEIGGCHNDTATPTKATCFARDGQSDHGGTCPASCRFVTDCW